VWLTVQFLDGKLLFSASDLVNFLGCRHAAKSGAQVKESVNKYGAKEEVMCEFQT
jgi:hypothetical protein